MLHRVNDEEEPVMDVTNRKVFQNGKIEISIYSEKSLGMAVNVAVLFPTVKL